MPNDPRKWLAFVPETLKASPLYTALWEGLKEDEELLALMDLIPKDQPNPITFFTAINYLVLAEPEHPFAFFYPWLHPEATPDFTFAYQLFRGFVNEHWETLRNILPDARLQTNEVTRCANLLPAFFIAYLRGEHKPLNMVEIGSSMGLNLQWNDYGYQYSSTSVINVGDTDSPVQVKCDLRGPYLPPLPDAELPWVASCQGIEISPRSIFHDEDVRWVRAAIWPEETARHQMLDVALAFTRNNPTVAWGDACDFLPAMLAGVTNDQTAVVWHSFAVNQGPVAVKEQIEEQIKAASRARTIYRVSLEVIDASGPRLELSTYENGAIANHEILAVCAFHGEWMEWLAKSTL